MCTMKKIDLERLEFSQLQDLIYKYSGIKIEAHQKEYLEYKIKERLEQTGKKDFLEYFLFLQKNKNERQEVINLITTNETYFFREKKHFEFLKNEIIPKIKYDTFLCWSAASSIGAEAYSIAMVLESYLSSYKNYKIVASDINSDVLSFATKGIYPLRFANKIPKSYLKEYCQRGKNNFEGYFKVRDKLKANIVFRQVNLFESIDPEVGKFDLIFLRNMILYFEDDEKKTIINNVLKHLKDGGYIFMGHSESLSRITDKVVQVSPSIYKKLPKFEEKGFRPISKVIGIGSSMGGLQVIKDTLQKLKYNTPPILISQHMSKDILPQLLENLSPLCEMYLKIAQNGEHLQYGHVYFAPYSKHLSIKKISKGVYELVVSDGEKVSNHKPSIDVMFHSMAVEAQKDANGFILSGMGNDGVNGILEIEKNGGNTFAQDEQSSDVFGMSKLAIQKGVSKVIAAEDIFYYIQSIR